MSELKILNELARECLMNIFRETSRLVLVTFLTILNSEKDWEKEEAFEDAINITIRVIVNKLTDTDAFYVIGKGALTLLGAFQREQTY